MHALRDLSKPLVCLIALALLMTLPLRGVLAEDEQPSESVMLVLDVSGSMWGQIDGEPKIVIARNAVRSLVASWPDDKQVGMVAYGHRKRGDCSDIETVLPVGLLDREALIKVVSGLTPRGMTPLSASVKLAAEELKFTEHKATVILISDGIENCNLDPCEVGAELENLGIDFTAHVIGFDVTSKEDQAGLRCLAENTGGMFISAENAEQLVDALAKTASMEVVQPAPTPEPEIAPTPVPLPEASISAPETGVKGTEVTVELDAPDGLGGYLYLYPAGRDKSLTYAPVREQAQGGYQPTKVRLPAEPGEYLIRWEGSRREHFAEAEIKAVEAEITIKVPEEAPISTAFSVEMDAPEGLDGYLYLYPVGRDRSIAYALVREAATGGYQSAQLRLPAEPGEYLVRWESSRREHLAEEIIRAVEAEVKIEAPEEAVVGTQVTVRLTAPDGIDGYIYLYAAGRDRSVAYGLVREDRIAGYQPVSIRMPATTGSFTFRWENSKREVLAEIPIELVAAEITLSHPEEVPAATEVQVSLEAPDGLDGYLYLYPKGRDKSLTYGLVREHATGGYNPVRLRVPAQPGDYEIQFQSGRRELYTKSDLKVVAAEVNIFTPEKAFKGSTAQFRVEAPPGIDGYLYLYEAGSDKHLSYHRVSPGRLVDYEPLSITVPEKAGIYDIKWITGSKELLAESSFEVVDEE